MKPYVNIQITRDYLNITVLTFSNDSKCTIPYPLHLVNPLHLKQPSQEPSCLFSVEPFYENHYGND